MSRIVSIILIFGIGITVEGSKVGESREGKRRLVNLDHWYDASIPMRDHFVKVGYDCLRQKKIFPKAIARFFRDEMGRKFRGSWLCSVFATPDEAIFESYGMTCLSGSVGSMYVRCANSECGRNFVEPTMEDSFGNF